MVQNCTSDAIDEDIQRPFQSVALWAKAGNPVTQFMARHSGEFLNPHNPCRPVNLDPRRQAGKRSIAPA